MTSSLPFDWLCALSVRPRPPPSPLASPGARGPLVSSRAAHRRICALIGEAGEGAGSSAVARRRPAVARPCCRSGGGAFSGGDGRVRARWSRDQVRAELRLGQDLRGGLGERQRQTVGEWAPARPEGPSRTGAGPLPAGAGRLRPLRNPRAVSSLPRSALRPSPREGPRAFGGSVGGGFGRLFLALGAGSADRGSRGFGQQPPPCTATPTGLP